MVRAIIQCTVHQLVSAIKYWVHSKLMSDHIYFTSLRRTKTRNIETMVSHSLNSSEQAPVQTPDVCLYKCTVTTHNHTKGAVLILNEILCFRIRLFPAHLQSDNKSCSRL